LRRSRATTVAAFFGARFNSSRVQATAGITIILALGGYLLAVTQGAAIHLSQLTDLSYVQRLIIAWFSYTIFTMYSDSRDVILTDTLMFLLKKLHVAPAEELDPKKTRTTLLAPAILIANGLIMPYLLITYYIRPLQSATGTLSPDGSLNWLTGEAILAVSWFVGYVVLGLFSIKVIRNAYSPVG